MNRYSSSLILLATLGASVAFEAGAAMAPSTSVDAGTTASSVALDGDTLIVGSPYNAVGTQQQAGRVYVYLRGASGWISQGEFAPSDRAAFDEFGSAVAISGDTAVVGAKRKNADQGAVYVFVRSGTSWSQQATLTNPASGGGPYSFGAAVAISGDTVVVGDSATSSSYVFKRTGTTWSQQSSLVAADGIGGNYFGCTVAISGDSALIGAPGVNAAYVFKSSDSSWDKPQQTKLSNSLPGYNYLGYAVDLSGRVALLGSPGESGGGAAYVFASNGTTWTQQARLAATGGAAAGDHFGKAVNLGGEKADVALIGAPGARRPNGNLSGVAHLFTRQGTAWTAHPSNPLYNQNSGSLFGVGPELGRSVSLFGDTAVAISFFGTADIFTFECGFGRDWPAGIWLFPGLPCNPGASATVADQFGDNLGTTKYGYNNRWYMYDWNEITNSLAGLVLTTPVSQGVGYELKTLDGGRVDFTGTATPIVPCPSLHPDGCFEIPLTRTSGSETYHSTLVGHPFPYPVDWADVRFSDNGNLYTPSQASSANIAYNNFKRYNGVAHESYNDLTPGLNGNLWPNEAVWVFVKPGATANIKLLIPAKPSRDNTSAAIPPADPARFALPERWLDWLIPAAEAAPWATEASADPARDARRKKYRDAIARHEDWYVRLIVETADGRYADPANVLGQLSDAAKGLDEHDLDEPPPLEDGPTLTVVFPHPDWKTAAGDYSSDFHPPSKNRGDAWNFEVRSNQRGILRLRWQASSPEALTRGQLVDEETGAIIAAADTDHYEFDLTVPVRAFRWEFLPNRDKPAN